MQPKTIRFPVNVASAESGAVVLDHTVLTSPTVQVESHLAGGATYTVQHTGSAVYDRRGRSNTLEWFDNDNLKDMTDSGLDGYRSFVTAVRVVLGGEGASVAPTALFEYEPPLDPATFSFTVEFDYTDAGGEVLTEAVDVEVDSSVVTASDLADAINLALENDGFDALVTAAVDGTSVSLTGALGVSSLSVGGPDADSIVGDTPAETSGASGYVVLTVTQPGTY